MSNKIFTRIGSVCLALIMSVCLFPAISARAATGFEGLVDLHTDNTREGNINGEYVSTTTGDLLIQLEPQGGTGVYDDFSVNPATKVINIKNLSMSDSSNQLIILPDPICKGYTLSFSGNNRFTTLYLNFAEITVKLEEGATVTAVAPEGELALYNEGKITIGEDTVLKAKGAYGEELYIAGESLFGELDTLGYTKLEFLAVKDIAGLDFKLAATSYDYTGSAITPEVTCPGLTKDVDYTVEYSDNINPGTAKVKITGKGLYKGTKTLEFTIIKKVKKDESIKDDQSGASYKVISIDNGNVEVEFEKSEQADAKKINVPDTITLPDGTVAKVTSIAPSAFSGNQSVTSITVGNNVETIGANAFSDCPKLKNLTIGKNVKSIGAKACKGSPKLNKVTIKSTKLKKIGKNAFKLKKGAVIKVPKKQKKAYEKLLKKSKLPAGVKVK